MSASVAVKTDMFLENYDQRRKPGQGNWKPKEEEKES